VNVAIHNVATILAWLFAGKGGWILVNEGAVQATSQDNIVRQPSNSFSVTFLMRLSIGIRIISHSELNFNSIEFSPLTDDGYLSQSKR
jgi:hypothetical protein